LFKKLGVIEAIKGYWVVEAIALPLPTHHQGSVVLVWVNKYKRRVPMDFLLDKVTARYIIYFYFHPQWVDWTF
jgi:hypothetical protein